MACGSVRKLKGGKERGRRFRDMIASAAAVILFALLLTSCAVKKQPDSIPAGKPVNENTSDGTGLMTIDTEPKTDWKAEWIWDRTDGTEENTWVVFRDTFTLEKVPETLRAYVSADSKYWLFVNGVNVIYEGGLKRGPDGNSGYYDTADIAPYLKAGENVIAAEVWYFGKDGSFSYIDSGRGGFLFEAEGDGVLVLSGPDWKAAKNRAYLKDEGNKQPNYRIAESNILYDARLFMGDYTAAGYDDSEWGSAVNISRGGEGPFGTLYPRPIPLLKVSELKDYENSAEFAGVTTGSTSYLTLDIPYNAQCVPYLCVEADAGKLIEITTENTALGSVITRYITTGGRQEFESRGWFNGEHISYKIPAGVKIIALKYRESGYNTEFTGSFTSDDEFMNTLWQKSLRTLYVTMRDNFMDCPDRERAQWWGDVTNEMAMTMYSMSPSSYLLYQKGVFNMLLSAENGILRTVVPAGEGAYFELPMQQLAGICGFKTYYMYTGDRDFVDMVYEPSLEYINLWIQGPDGLVVHRSGSWDWMDWGDGADVVCIENAWYYKALDTVRYFASVKNDSATEAELSERMEMLYGAYQLKWTPKGYMGSVRTPDDRANALAVLSGLADVNDSSRFSTIKHVLTSVYNSSPYMERYVLDALCEMGLVEEAQARIRTRYKAMVEEDYSTLWEFWDKDSGTVNHAWSGGPMLSMSQYMAGIAPAEPGYSTYTVTPDLGGLHSIECVVPTVKGPVSVNISDDGTYKLSLDSPPGTCAIVKLPCAGQGKAVYLNGEKIFYDGAAAPGETRFTGFEAGRACFLVDALAQGGKFDFEIKDEPAAETGAKLTVSVIAAEHGTLTVNGTETEKGTRKQFEITGGSTVTLSAQADPGYEFAYFTGSLGGRAPSVSFTATHNMSIGAVFAEKRSDYSTLTVYMPEESDTNVKVNGRKCMFAGGKAEVTVHTGSEVTIEVEDGLIGAFLNFSGPVQSEEKTVTFTVDKNTELMVNTRLLYGDDLAVGAKATCTCSLESGSTWSVSNLTDGKLSTGFTTEVLDTLNGVLKKPVVINIDLGSVKEFSLISLAPRTDTVSISGGNPCYPLEFTVKTSRSGSDYTEAGSFTQKSDPAGVVQSYEFDAVKARFVRIEITKAGDYAADEGIDDPYRVQIMEIMLRKKNEN